MYLGLAVAALAGTLYEGVLLACAGKTHPGNAKTVSFVMTDPEACRQPAANAAQPVPPEPAPPSPPSQPRAGFLRNHLQQFRTSYTGSHGEKEISPSSSTNTDTNTVSSHHSMHERPEHQNRLTQDSEYEQESSLSAVLLANAQPMGRPCGSLDRLPAVQRSSLCLQASPASRSLLDNAADMPTSTQGQPPATHHTVPSCAVFCPLAQPSALCNPAQR